MIGIKMQWIDSRTGEEFNLSDYPEAFGFIYRIDYTNGQFYLGKKNFFNKVVLPKNSNRKKKEIIYRESIGWKSYIGSTKLAGDLKIKQKTILELASTKRALTYLEIKLLFKYDAIFNEKCLNQNIGGLYYDNVLDDLKVPTKKEYR